MPKIEDLLNLTTHHGTGYSHLELHYGVSSYDSIGHIFKFPPQSVISHDVKLVLARERLQREFNGCKRRQQRCSKIPLKVGDLVLLRVPGISNAVDGVTKKFFKLYEDPYVIKCCGDEFLFIG